jgi:hypothetical protein
MRNIYTVLIGRPEGKCKLADLGVDGRIMLKCILIIYEVVD